MGLPLESGDLGFLGYWWWDLSSDRVHTEGKLDELFGIHQQPDREGLPIAFYEKSVHPDDLAWVQSVRPHCFGVSGHGAIEYRVIDPTGSVRWVMCRAIYETDAEGEVVRAHGMIIDMTDLKRDGLSVRTKLPDPVDHEGVLVDATLVAYQAAKMLGDTDAVRLLRAVLEAAGRRLARQLTAQKTAVH